jgi:5,6-dimethylbenzimidazole synthase
MTTPQQRIFSEQERNLFYDLVKNRRDTRREFTDEPISDDVLMRILEAAHHAPSVGFMQPWDFTIIKKSETKQLIKDLFIEAHEKAKAMFEGDRREKYSQLKLEGIMESPVGICITCDRTRNGPVVIGRTSIPEMDIYSVVCAVQILWLAARAENLGVGWVSILDPQELKKILSLPDHVEPIAYLCVGHVEFFHEKPELEKVGWLDRININELVHLESFGRKLNVSAPSETAKAQD